ncbi:MAG: ATP-binding protein [Chloroflexota bacterium]
MTDLFMQRTLRELFVDRDRQLQAFSRMADGLASRRIMIVTAGPGMGKSWLLRMFAEEARNRELPVVYIDFADGVAYEVITLVRRFRDAFGAEHFNALTEAINEATTARVELVTNGSNPAPRVDVNVAESSVSGSSIAVSEVGTIIKDNNFVLETDNPIIRQAIEDRITIAFFECLIVLSEKKRVVFLFDTYERNSLDAHSWSPNTADRWIYNQLLIRMRDGRLPNVIAVLAGRRMRDFGIEWNEVLGRMSLDPLECDDVKEYLRERRGLSQITEAEGDRLCQAVAGNPQVLGLIGDNLEQANQPQVADDEW